MASLEKETFHIKGMCCSRCVRAVKEELSKLAPEKLIVRIGEAELEYDSSKISQGQIQRAIEDAGFETMTLLKEQKIEEVKQYVRDHITDPEALRLSAISRAMAVSPFHLSRTFSLLANETLQDFITRTRMERSAQLLRDTERSVLDICLEVGFSSTSHFTKLFKKYFGQTPLAYRKNPRKEPHIFRKMESDLGKGLSHVYDEIREHFASIHGSHFSKEKK
jgi:AraC-like DNA-binding protein